MFVLFLSAISHKLPFYTGIRISVILLFHVWFRKRSDEFIVTQRMRWETVFVLGIFAFHEIFTQSCLLDLLRLWNDNLSACVGYGNMRDKKELLAFVMLQVVCVIWRLWKSDLWMNISANTLRLLCGTNKHVVSICTYRGHLEIRLERCDNENKKREYL